MSEDHGDEEMLLNNPQTKKECEHGESFAFCGMQGWRKSNEDFHKHFIPFNQNSFKLWSYFAIFDGHNGIDTAKNASELLDKYLLDTLEKMNDKSKDGRIDSSDFNHSIKQTFLQFDQHLSGLIHDQSGSVAIVALIAPKEIYLINLGDSRGIIIAKDGEVLSSTVDHKPNVRKEEERIRKAGGRVTKHPNDVPRVENLLAVSRALGDYSLDKHLIPASPSIIQYSRQSSAHFLILACDGIWDVMSNEEVAHFVSKRTANTSLEHIAQQLIDHCLQLQSMDNMSLYIIQLEVFTNQIKD